MDKITTNVAGISFAIKDNPELKNLEVQIGGEVKLYSEPENEYDPKAIRLEYNGHKIGYVPKKKDGVDFSIQAWCEENLDKITCVVDQAWYGSGKELTSEYAEGLGVSGIYVKFTVPQDNSNPNDLIITKHSFSEPNIIVEFNDTQHIYNMRTKDGYKVLKGGTTFIKRFYKPFDPESIAGFCAKSWGVDEQTIKDIWKSNGKLAGGFGSILHEALEHYINYGDIGAKITKVRKSKGKPETENYAMPKHPFLKKTIKSLNRMVKKLDKEYNVEEVVAEALVTDSKTGWGGLIDRLAIIDSKNKIARVQDYKVNIGAEEITPNLKPLDPFSHLPANKLTKYALQMSFYAAILQKHGWIIEGLDVFVFESNWIHHELDMIDFSILKKGKK
jgi:hypothetical protein